jgi:hypothetical protein
MLIAHMLAAVLWTCSVPLLPDHKSKTNAPNVGEGVTYFYAGDRRLRADCILHRNGIFWQEQRPGTFAVRGAFYPGESTFFTGVTADSRCKT